MQYYLYLDIYHQEQQARTLLHWVDKALYIAKRFKFYYLVVEELEVSILFNFLFLIKPVNNNYWVMRLRSSIYENNYIYSTSVIIIIYGYTGGQHFAILLDCTSIIIWNCNSNHKQMSIILYKFCNNRDVATS